MAFSSPCPGRNTADGQSNLGSELTKFASGLPVWAVADVLTRGTDLDWKRDADGALTYTAGAGTGQVFVQVTDDVTSRHPDASIGDAARALITSLDPKAVAVHLLCAAKAVTQKCPWVEEFSISYEELASCTGLGSDCHMPAEQKQRLLERLVMQLPQILVQIVCPKPNKTDVFSVEQERLWKVRIEHRKKGVVAYVKPGQWARHFLNSEAQKSKTGYFQFGYYPEHLIPRIARWSPRHEGAARLAVWLLFKLRLNPEKPVTVSTLMRVAYGDKAVQEATLEEEAFNPDSRQRRNRLAERWNSDLLELKEAGFDLVFQPGSYAPELQPDWTGTNPEKKRPRGYWERLKAARLLLRLPAEAHARVATFAGGKHKRSSIKADAFASLAAEQIRDARTTKGWSQGDLAAVLGVDRTTVSRLESGIRRISPELAQKLRGVLGSQSAGRRVVVPFPDRQPDSETPPPFELCASAPKHAALQSVTKNPRIA